MRGLYDIHCHIIPHVDDGAETMEETIKMLKLEYAEGVRHIIATPHFRFGMFETPLEKVQTQFEKVREIAGNIGRDGIDMYLGCEFHVTMDMAGLLRKKKVLTMAGSRYVLVEFSGLAPKSQFRECLYSLISSGYKPIIAHVERCEKLRGDYRFIEELVEMGAGIQVNAESIMGNGGFAVKRFCHKLMKEDLLHYVGTDSHGSSYRPPKIQDACRYVAKKMGEDYAEQIFIRNPAEITKEASSRAFLRMYGK